MSKALFLASVGSVQDGELTPDDKKAMMGIKNDGNFGEIMINYY